jgi:methionine biosynthesis protein MetW
VSSSDCSERIYKNAGNQELLKLVSGLPPGRVLDCGCGAGDNARALSSSGWDVVGITISSREKEEASRFCSSVYLHNLELGLPADVNGNFDLVVFSHVLEHIRNPSKILQDVRKVMASGGRMAVALPNVLYWRYRLQFLLGRFEYEETGIMDSTHVHFYTFESGKKLLETNGFRVIESTVEGSFPLRPLRNILPDAAHSIDRLACRLWPGCYGLQLLYVAELR